MPARLSDGNRLETLLPVAQFREVFGVDVKQEPATIRKGKEELEGSLTRQDKFLKPVEAVPVPDALKETVDYAYVPRPVEFYGVSYIPPNEKVYHLDLQSVALALNAVRCHREGWTGVGVKVAMADTGFTPHPFFEQGGYKIIRLGAAGVADPTVDDSGHGTGESANVLTLAPSVTLICIKQGDSAAAALEACLAQDPDVMTHSWGWHADRMTKDQLKQADPNLFNEFLDVETVIAEAINLGITVCFSAGNGHLSFPACLPQVVAVGGTTVMPDSSLTASSYASSFTSKLFPGRKVPDVCGIVGESSSSTPLKGHIMLPVPANSELDGENFSPKQKGTGWGIFSGTSAASPQIAGVVALMKSINKNLKSENIRSNSCAERCRRDDRKNRNGRQGRDRRRPGDGRRLCRCLSGLQIGGVGRVNAAMRQPVTGGDTLLGETWSAACSQVALGGILAPRSGFYVRLIFQDVAGLTIEHHADPLQGIEADAFHLAGLQQRNVLLGDADALGKLLRAHLAARQHHVEIDDDRHHTKPAFSSAMRAASRITVAAANSTPPTISAK